MKKKDSKDVLDILENTYPDAECELVHSNPFELLLATVLSAQTTDKKVNQVTERLFKKYKNPQDFANLNQEELEVEIKEIGLYRNKAKNIKACAQQLLEKFDGQVPQTREELILLPGVGRKTANVVLGDAFDIPAIAVDTHVERVSKRLRICKLNANVIEVEETLMRKVPEELWVKTHHTMIFFGRYHCIARSPKCEKCPLLDMCQEGKERMRA